MTRPDLIGYLTETLDDQARREVDVLLDADLDLRDQLELLRERLAPLDLVKQPEAPPLGLAMQTLAFVAEHVSRDPVEKPAEAPVTTVARPCRALADRPWWRRLDVLVAASLLLMVAGTVPPTLLHLRRQGVQIECQNNLRTFWSALESYQTQHGRMPDIGSLDHPAAGMVVPILQEAGLLTEGAKTFCPGADGVACVHRTMNELSALRGKEFDLAASKLLPGYAYALGFRDDAGNLHGSNDIVGMNPAISTNQIPVLADAPEVPVILEVNSPNHAGGQNILFLDGTLRFQTNRHVGPRRDDIYLNQANKVAAGLGPHDVALGVGTAVP